MGAGRWRLVKLHSLKRHLAPYQIHARRATTINHAFCSALAPVDSWDPARAAQAMATLGQTNLEALTCVYCGGVGQTWDHLEPLVRNSLPSGFGHTLGNLVPSCRDCNSAKGNRPWREWVTTWPKVPKHAGNLLQAYVEGYLLRPQDLEALRTRHPEEIKELQEIWGRILDLMKAADGVVARVRTSHS